MRGFSTIIVVGLSICLLVGVSSAQLVQNPSFEQVQIGPPYQTYVTADIPSWTHSGSLGDSLLWAVGAINGLVSTAGAGNQFVTLGGGISGPGSASWTTRVTTLTAGGSYILSFKIANEGEAPSQTMTATLSNGATASGTFTTTCGYGVYYWKCWQRETLPFTATRGVATLTFSVTNQQYDMGLDDITITRVPPTGGQWAPLAHQPSFYTGAAVLLTDGTVLAHEESDRPGLGPNYGNWWRLTPDVYGSYVNGTWSTVPSTLPSPYGPLFFASAVLVDGRAIAEGGEYNNGSSADTTLGAIFDPTVNPPVGQWTSVSPPPNWVTIGDAQSAVLPDGTFMLADCCSTEEAEMAPPYSGPWVATGLLKHDLNDEEGWTLLPGPPDAEVLLTVDADVLGLSTCGSTGVELYINGYWFCIASTPTQLWDNNTHEMGPAVLRPDGTVVQAGGTNQFGSGQTAIFNSSLFTWTAGPSFPNHQDVADGPAALLPNGNVLIMASPGYVTPPSTFYTFQYGSNNLIQEATSPPNSGSDSSEEGHMLVLPTGQIYFADYTKDVEIYTSTDQRYSNSWEPVIADINSYPIAKCFAHITPYPPPPCLTISQGSTNTVDGFQLNGLSQGAAYGDDYQSATNYPLVRITEEIQPFCVIGMNCPVPRVFYCRTHDHSNMGVATGNLLVSTKFDCPNVPLNFQGYLSVVVNGIAGGGVPVKVGP